MDKCYYFFLNSSSSIILKGMITFLPELLVLSLYFILYWCEFVWVRLLKLFEPLGQGEVSQSHHFIFLLNSLLVLNTVHSVPEKLWYQIMMLALQLSHSLKCCSVLLAALLSSWRVLRYDIFQLFLKAINLYLNSRLVLLMVTV